MVTLGGFRININTLNALRILIVEKCTQLYLTQHPPNLTDQRIMFSFSFSFMLMLITVP